MPIEQQLTDTLKQAMRDKDQRTADVVRMIKTKIMERRTAKDFTGQVDDKLILDVIASYKKQMEKARAEYVAAGERGKEQVAELEFEIQWCAGFLPKQMSEAELREVVAKHVAALPAKDPKMAGKIIGMVKKELGDLADAQLTKKLADELLKP